MSVPMTPGSSGVYYRPNRAPVIDEDGPTDAAVADVVTEEAEKAEEVVELEVEADAPTEEVPELEPEEAKRRPGRPKKVVESSEPE
jgi:hypothetical protein